ncbi:MAG TPA: choice-of-anchor Q domain-containing protein [Candidatus Binatia bacterium]|jgi:hypothetical protein|nr:choice-of-anchor Q domain-containing protein [Candidatus Binatia bacterium]
MTRFAGSRGWWVAIAWAVLTPLAGFDVQAADFRVDVTADNLPNTTSATDTTPGDGTCRASTGLCTLRAAVQEANALAGPDTIVLPSGTYAIRAGAEAAATADRGDLDVSGELTIKPVSGAQPVIDAVKGGRIFELAAGAQLTLEGLTLRNGDATVETTCDASGGAVCAINARLVVRGNCTIEGNRAVNGGAVYGLVEATGSIFQNNTATSVGGAVAGRKDQLTEARLVVTSSTFTKNQALADGGGGDFGGAIAVYDGAGMDLATSTFTQNTAGGTGGALSIRGAATVTVRNSTFSANTASGSAPTGPGGGIEYASDGGLELSNVTIARNSGQGLALATATGVSVRNTLVVLNLPTDCTGDLSGGSANLVSSTTGCTVPPGSLAADPKIATGLADNGGTTQTIAIVKDGPADDHGAACESTDQRGYTRGNGGKCDIGAFELVPESDDDLIPDADDNCPGVSNRDQLDTDADGMGDACECSTKSKNTGGPNDDDDTDGILNPADCCPNTPKLLTTVDCLPGGTAADSTGCSVAQSCDCALNFKNDVGYPWGARRRWKKCVRTSVRKLDGVGRRCKRDVRQAILNDASTAACGTTGVGSGDSDGDSFPDSSDNCPRIYNPLQTNSDEDIEKGGARGDACDDDDDGDNIPDGDDKCPTILSCDNDDADSDGVGNECDECPWENNGGPIDKLGCEKGQEGKGAADPPAACNTKPPSSDDTDDEE